MHGTLHRRVLSKTESVRTDVQRDEIDEQMFDVLAQIARKVLWPDNTAPNLAAAAKCSVRAAEYYLSGGRDWSSDAIAVIVGEIMKRHGMRNAKVVKRSS
jgi:hypothetical protein